MVAEEVFVNCYNFNPISKVEKGNFQGIFKNDPLPGTEQEPEPEPQFGFATTRSQSRKK